MPPIEELLHPSNPNVLVAAHRGVWSWTPENSIPAIEEAIALGADIVEIDVRSTSDGVLVLQHDATLDRMTSGRGPVSSMPWAVVRSARLRSGAGGPEAPVTSTRPATLSEILERARGRIAVNIDVKEPGLENGIADLVVAAGMSDQVFVKAFVNGPEDVRGVLASPFFGRVPFVPMMKVRRGELVPSLRRVEALRCPMVEVEFDDLDELESARTELGRLQARLWVNTIQVSHSLDLNDHRAASDPEAVWGRLLAAGVGAIQTDAVDALVQYLKARGAR
jgi:glycerophosphoryl diester phosphodiesterase